MTLLMVMVVAHDCVLQTPVKRNTLLLLETIIEKKIFDDSYMAHKAIPSLNLQFELQHYQGLHKVGKKKNSVIVAGQRITLKRVKIKTHSEEYVDRVSTMKKDQVKMISREKVKLRCPDGTEMKKRIMITCRVENSSLNKLTVKVENDNFYSDGHPLATDYFSIDPKEDDEIEQLLRFKSLSS